jgi:hypothetical protein
MKYLRNQTFLLSVEVSQGYSSGSGTYLWSRPATEPHQQLRTASIALEVFSAYHDKIIPSRVFLFIITEIKKPTNCMDQIPSW